MTREELERRLAGRKAGERLDLLEEDLDGLDLRGLHELRDIDFGLRDDPRSAASLRATNLGDVRLVNCRFAGAELDRTYLRNATLTGCDLRYTRIVSATFAGATLEDCDLYRAAIEGNTVFEGARLVAVSLDRARLDGVADLVPSSLGADPEHPELLQEDAARYRRFLAATDWYSGGHADIEQAMRDRRARAATVYRRLAGMWSDRGEYGCAGWAYVRARKLERRALRPGRDGRWSDLPQWAWLGVAGLATGFGERARNVAAIAALLVVVPAVVYALAGAVRERGAVSHDLGDALLFSLGQVTTASPERLSAAAPSVELAGELQTLTGIVLLGLLGFVLGNRIRMS